MIEPAAFWVTLGGVSLGLGTALSQSFSYITEGQFYLRNGVLDPFRSLSRLKQLVNGKSRADHRTLMNAMIQLYASYRETLEKQSMGFRMSDWDRRLLRYGALFQARMMDLTVNIPLEEALDLGWRTLAECFEPMETGIPTEMIARFWPASVTTAKTAG